MPSCLLECRRCGAPGRACPGPPTAGRGSPGRAGTARTPRRAVVRVGLGRRSRRLQVGQVVGRRGSATARSRWPGSRRTAAITGVRYVERDPRGLERGVEAVGRACGRDDRAPAPRRCGRTSPAAGRPARSWSAARSRGRRAGCRRSAAAARALTARPIVSLLSATPGPDVVVTPSAPPNEPHPARRRSPAISSSAWNVRDAEAACACDSSCRMSDAGGDRVGAQEQRQARPAGRRRSGRRPAPGCR